MAELVDALDSKSGYRKVVQVRFLFWAQAKVPHKVRDFFMGATEACFRERTEKNPRLAKQVGLLLGYAPLLGSRRNAVEPTILYFIKIHINF